MTSLKVILSIIFRPIWLICSVDVKLMHDKLPYIWARYLMSFLSYPLPGSARLNSSTGMTWIIQDSSMCLSVQYASAKPQFLSAGQFP